MKLRLGTRGSKLALAQTALAADAIRIAVPDAEIETVIIATKGDKILNRPLAQIGGKGVFIGEIEAALASGKIDLAVHSAKDLPPAPAPGTEIAAVLQRGNPLDALVIRKDASEQLTREKSGFYRIGTGSARRISGLQNIYPNAAFCGIRGNIDTRLEKLCRGEYDAIVLACAGLARLHLSENARYVCVPLAREVMVPAPCQGIIAIQTRKGDFPELMRAISHTETQICYETERFVMRLLDAGCNAPIGANAEIRQGYIRLFATNGHKTICQASAEIPERFALAERLVKQL